MNIPLTIATESAARFAVKRAAYLNHLLELANQPITDLAWAQSLRDRALLSLQDRSFPTTRDEEWRFTDLSALLQVQFSQASTRSLLTEEDFINLVLPEAAESRLVFVDGAYAPEWSAIAQIPSPVFVGSIAQLPEAYRSRISSYLGQQPGFEEVFTALNTVGLRDVAIIWVPCNSVVEQPIHLLFVSTAGTTPVFQQPRCLVVAAANSAVTVLEDYIGLGTGTYFTNPVTEIWVDENAQVNHTRIQRDRPSAFQVGKTVVSQARDSRYTCNALNFGAALSRHNLEIYQTGEQTETVLNGLTSIREEQIADTHSAIVLSQPYGRTKQLQKCIVDDRAHAIFNGKVFVPQKAQLTDAQQMNRNLLLSPKARVDTKPQLEIVADNVRCTHGATVGQLEQEEIFYLQSRGIDAASARKLLVYAFAYEMIEQVPVVSLRDRLTQLVNPAV
jgi:Fe-S cluster assembly protein SufD